MPFQIGWSFRVAPEAYRRIKQPPLAPPPEVFGPVWTALYGLMGYGAHRAYAAGILSASLTSPSAELPSWLFPFAPGPASAAVQDVTRAGMTLYTLQLGLNLAWMPLFFGLKRPIEATASLVLLTAANAYLTFGIWDKVDSVAKWCFVPYVAWLGFATYLSAGVGYLNGWDLGAMDAKPAVVEKGKDVDRK